MLDLKRVGEIVQQWFEEERGNRVTSNNVQGLMMKLSVEDQKPAPVAKDEKQEGPTPDKQVE
jgi:hypothetical protein